MEPPSQFFRVEYITRLAQARAAYGREIAKRVPQGISVRDRGSSQEVAADHPTYLPVYNRFMGEVTDEHACNILEFLYQVDVYFATEAAIFAHYYKKLFEDSQWNALMYNFPRLNQSEIAIIIGVSETLIGTRLDHLHRIGLVERPPVKPPRPRHAKLTALGREVIEAAIDEGFTHLTPLFDPPSKTTSPATSASPDARDRPQFP